MCLTAILGLAGSAISANAQRRAAATAANAQRSVVNQAITAQKPWADTGIKAQNALAFEMGLGARPADYQGFTATPSYGFRLKQGQDAIEASAAARGGLFSGAAGKELARFGQDLGAAEYDSYLQRLGGLSSTGQSAVMGNSNALAMGANATGAQALAGSRATTGLIDNALGIYGYMDQQAKKNGGQGRLFGGNSWG